MKIVSLDYHSLYDQFYAVDSPNMSDLGEPRRRRVYSVVSKDSSDRAKNLVELLSLDFDFKNRKTQFQMSKDFPKDVEDEIRDYLSKHSFKVVGISRVK